MVCLKSSKSSELFENNLQAFESESIDFFSKVRMGYLEIAKSNPDRIIILDAELSVKDLQNTIFNEVKNRLDATLD